MFFLIFLGILFIVSGCIVIVFSLPVFVRLILKACLQCQVTLDYLFRFRARHLKEIEISVCVGVCVWGRLVSL